MQDGKSAVEATKKAAADVGASAWAGMEKTKAVLQEKVDKMAAHDPVAKAAAEATKEERIAEVEAEKQEAMRQNAAAAKERTTATMTQGAPAVVDCPASSHAEPGIVESKMVGAETGAVHRSAEHKPAVARRTAGQ